MRQLSAADMTSKYPNQSWILYQGLQACAQGEPGKHVLFSRGSCTENCEKSDFSWNAGSVGQGRRRTTWVVFFSTGSCTLRITWEASNGCGREFPQYLLQALMSWTSPFPLGPSCLAAAISREGTQCRSPVLPRDPDGPECRTRK